MTDNTISMSIGQQGDGYKASGALQWTQLCPHMSHGARNMFAFLSSILHEGNPVRVFTLEELAEVLPSTPVAVDETPKGLSLGTVRRQLTELSELGQITGRDGEKLSISRVGTVKMRIQVWRYPRHQCGCPRNGYDAIDMAAGGNAAWPAATIVKEAKGRAPRPKRTTKAKPTVPEPRTPKSKGPASRGSKTASEEAKQIAQEGLPSGTATAIRKVAARVDEALKNGWDPEKLRRNLKAPYRKEAVVDLVGLMMSRLPQPGEAPPVKPEPKKRSRPIHDCPTCWGTGHEEDATGKLTGRKCTHPKLPSAS